MVSRPNANADFALPIAMPPILGLIQASYSCMLCGDAGGDDLGKLIISSESDLECIPWGGEREQSDKEKNRGGMVWYGMVDPRATIR